MIPSKSGVYWVKDKGWEDGHWCVASYVEEDGWYTIGEECRVDEDSIIEIGPEIIPPEKE